MGTSTHTGIIKIGGVLGSEGSVTLIDTTNHPPFLSSNSTINTTPGAVIPFLHSITSAAGKILSITGAGTAIFSADNSATLQSDITIYSSTAQINDHANIGTGTFTLTGTSPTIIIGDTTPSKLMPHLHLHQFWVKQQI